MEGCVDALAELDARGWRVFVWDVAEAAAVDDEIRRALLREDGSLRLDDAWVREVLDEIALANRMWRIANGFMWPIRR